MGNYLTRIVTRIDQPIFFVNKFAIRSYEQILAIDFPWPDGSVIVHGGFCLILKPWNPDVCISATQLDPWVRFNLTKSLDSHAIAT